MQRARNSRDSRWTGYRMTEKWNLLAVVSEIHLTNHQTYLLFLHRIVRPLG